MGARRRIPQEELDRIKREVSLADVVRRAGVVLQGHGKNLIGLCPFHNDTSPSLIVTPENNLWNCLGACGKGGDAIEWVMRFEKISFTRAVAFLKNLDKLDPNATCAAHKMQLPVKTPDLPADAPIPEDERQKLLRPIVDYYHRTLKDSPQALEYLKKRRIDRPEAMEIFKLGYANRTLAYHFATWDKRRIYLKQLGVFRNESGHEHLAGCLVVPITTPEGAVGQMYGRKLLGNQLRKGTVQHLYLPGEHKTVWNLQAFATSKELILCEALIDALTFWCAGYPNVTAAYGINGFRSCHLEAIKHYGIERVWIAYDRDDEGEKAAERLAPVLREAGYEVFRAEFPLDQDANEFACSVSDPADALGSLLRGARWLGKPPRPPTPPCPADPPAAAKEKEQTPKAPPAPDSSPASLDSIFPLAEQTPPPEPLTPASPEALESAPTVTPSALPKPPASCAPDNLRVIDFEFGSRRWRVQGLENASGGQQMRVVLRLLVGERCHVDHVDLYSDASRQKFVKRAAEETAVLEDDIRKDIGHLLRELEERQDRLIRRVFNPQTDIHLTEEERAEALAFLRSPNLVERIAKDFETVGIVGERANVLVGYFAAVSRKLDEPLAIIIQSSSAAGKTAVMEAILSLMPKEEYEKYSAVTGQALFYMSETKLKHKIIAITEEEGAERASYALKLLQSEGKLVIIATGKDPKTGDFRSKTYEVEGPVMILITTTNIEIDPELENRCLIVTVNEDREQTEKILDNQRERQTLAGFLKRRRADHILRVHQNAQRLLQQYVVVNELARRLTFPATQLRARRDNKKYLTLINAIALLHQYQRKVRQVECAGQIYSYIEAEPSDIKLANELANEILGRSLNELPPQTCRVLQLIYDMVQARCKEGKLKPSTFHFSRRDVREHTGLGYTQLNEHMKRLGDFEYLIPHRADRGLGTHYELLYNGEGLTGEKFFMGLIDPETLLYDDNRPGVLTDRSGQNEDRSGVCRPEVGPNSGGCRGRIFSGTILKSISSRRLIENFLKTHNKGTGNGHHRNHTQIKAASE